MQASPRSLAKRGVALAAVALAVACTRGPATSTTTTTSESFDVDTGPCLCRLPQDEMSTCCRSGMAMTCQCNGANSYACNLVPNGRRCGGA